MQVSIEKSEGIERIIDITIPGGDVQSKVDAKLSELGRDIRLKGFRKGKVPKKILSQRFGEHARQEVMGELMNDSLQEAIKENKLELANAPEVTSVDNQDDGGFTFKAKIELMPELPELALGDVKVNKFNSEVTESDIDNMLNNLRKQKQEWRDSKGKVARGDLLSIEYSATGKDLKYPEKDTEKMGVLLGESRIPEALEKALVGMKVTESADIDMTFPKEFHIQPLANQKVKMNFTINEVKKPKLPEVDADFVKSFGVESGDADELKKEINTNLERELAQAIEYNFKNELLGALRGQCKDMQLPESMIRRESEFMAQQQMEQTRQMGVKNPPMPDVAAFRNQAIERVLNALILQNVAKQQNIQTDFTRVREKINELAQTFENPQEIVQMYYANQELMSNVEQSVQESQVIEWLSSQVNVKDKKESLDNILKPKK